MGLRVKNEMFDTGGGGLKTREVRWFSKDGLSLGVWGN